ncbi:MAG: NMD3-related protein [Thermoprotei archaeon]
MQEKCLVCGRSKKEVLIYKGICLDCFLHDRKVFEFKDKKVHFIVCPICGDHLYKGSWRRSNDTLLLRNDFKSIILSNIKINMEDSIIDIKFDSDVEDFIKHPGNNRINASVKIKLHGYGVVINRDIYMYINVKHKICDRCLNEVSGNYEAILQIRGSIDKEEMNQLYLTVSKSLEKAYKSGRDYRLIDQKEVDNGVDFYFSSYNEAVRVTRELKKQFGGNITETRKLVKIKGGKKVARHTLLLRINED